MDSKYTFEIGGRNKTFTQIAGMKDSYIFADDWDMPDGAKLPLWMLGFLGREKSQKGVLLACKKSQKGAKYIILTYEIYWQ